MVTLTLSRNLSLPGKTEGLLSVCVCGGGGGVLIRINESISIISLWSLERLITSLFFFFKCYGDRSVTASLRTWDPTSSVFNFAISQAWHQETANDITRDQQNREPCKQLCIWPSTPHTAARRTQCEKQAFSEEW